MTLKCTRRQFMVGSALGGASLLIPSTTPFIRKARGQSTKPLVFASAGTVTGSWDPSSHTVAPQITAEGFVFGRLTRCPMRVENPNEIQPDLATSWKLIDKYTLEFSLRRDVKFHDGKPFKAEDVKATFEYASQPSRPAAAWYPGLVDVEEVNPHTVRLHTEKYGYPAAAFWYVVSFLPILSAKDIADKQTLQQRPNGTGPFKYHATNGDVITFKAYDDYHEGRPQINQLEYVYVPNSNTRILGLLNGEYHLTERLEPEQILSLEKNSSIIVDKRLSSENKYLHFRCNKPPFDDQRVRMAACNAVDRSQILELVGIAGKKSSCYISPVKFGYLDIPGYPEYDPVKCQRLLAAAGYPKGKGLPDLEYITSIGFYPKTKEYGEVITAMLQEQGFPVNLTVLEPAAWEDQIYRRADGQGPGHLVDVGWITGSPEPDLVLRPNWHSSAALITGINDPEIDAVLDKERNADNTEKRLKILQTETLPTLAEKVPSLSLFSAAFFHAKSKRLKGEYYYPNGPVDLSKAQLV
jgi:peptide/nickel transport system substrate-binding protein